MTRLLLALVLAASLVGAWIVSPAAVPADEDPGLEPAAAAAAVCPVQVERTTDGKLTLASTFVQPARVTVGNAGTVVTDVTVEIGEAGGTAVPFGEVGIGGIAGAFVEFGDPSSGAAAVSRGSAGVTAAHCPELIRTSSVIPGASTRNGETLDLILVNPYGADAVVAIESASEIGVDSADELSSVVVPARSTVVRDLTTLLPLRNRLSLAISPIRGLVHAFVEGGGGGDRVVLEHVAPRSEWVAPVPALAGDASLVLASVSPVEVAVRVDGWTEGEFVEGVVTATIPPREQLEIPLGDLPLDIVQVLSDGPVGASIVVEGELGRGATPMGTESLPEWLMPGPGSDGSIAWIGVPGDTGGTVDFQSLEAGGDSFSVEAAPGTTTPVPLDGQTIGYALRADVPITVIWSVSDQTGIGLGSATPVRGGV